MKTVEAYIIIDAYTNPCGRANYNGGEILMRRKSSTQVIDATEFLADVRDAVRDGNTIRVTVELIGADVAS